jgi:hypothetical protein
MLGVASSKLVEEISPQSILLAAAAVCLMYVGDSGRSAEERVSTNLPLDAKPDVVKSTRVHNLSGRLVLPATGLAAVCVIAAAITSLVDTNHRHDSNRPTLGINAPRFYRVASPPPAVVVSCPDQCRLDAGLVGSGPIKPLETVLMGRGSVRVELARVAEAASGEGDQPIFVSLSRSRHAKVATKIQVVP